MLDHLTPLRILALALLLFVFSMASKEIISSNDGSNYALIKAIAFDGTFVIDPYISHTQNLDLSKYGDHFYSDRPPGTAMLAQIFVVPVTGIMTTFGLDVSPRTFMALSVFVCNILAVGNVMLLFFIFLRLGCKPNPSFFAALLFGLCSSDFRYGTALYSHVPSAFFILLSFYLLISTKPPEHRFDYIRLIFFGVVVGFSATVEYINALLGPLIMAGIWLLFWRDVPRKNYLNTALKTSSVWCFGWLVGAGVLFWYNWVCFDNPFHTSYTHHHVFKWAHSFSETFSGDPFKGLYGLLIQLKYRGLFIVFPLLWFIFPGVVIMWKAGKRHELLIGWAVFAVFTILMAHHRTFFGGGTTDTRYIFFVTALLYIPVGFFIDAIWSNRGEERLISPAMRNLTIIIFIVAAAASFFWQVRLYFHFPNYSHSIFWIRQADGFAETVGQILKYSFPGSRFAGLYAAMIVPIAGVVFLFKYLRGRRETN